VPEYIRTESIKVVSLDEKHKHVNDMVVAAQVELKPKAIDEPMVIKSEAEL
jgi:hypothetical protein